MHRPWQDSKHVRIISRLAELSPPQVCSALRKMNVPHKLVQVVEAGNSTAPKVLRVNYPLAELMDEKLLIEKTTLFSNVTGAYC